MDVISSGILNVTFFEAELTRLLHNSVGGLRNYTNNKGIVVGNQIRFPLIDTDGMAQETNDGAPTNPSQLFADTATATIKPYEAATMVSQFDLASTNSAAGVRSAAAEKVVSDMEARATDLILAEMDNYDTATMELGDHLTDFTVDSFADLDYLARKNNWGDAGRFILLPPQAENTLKKDEKFYQIWSLRNGGKEMVDGIPTSDDGSIVFYPYGKWNVGFMGQKSAGNVAGLPVDDGDGAATGYAWLGARVGYGSNQAMQGSIFVDKAKQGNPLVFKNNGSMGSALIDLQGVIGVKLDATEPV